MSKQNKNRILIGVATDGKGGIDGYILSFVKFAYQNGIFCDVLTSKFSKDYQEKLNEFKSDLIPIANLHNRKNIYSEIHKLNNEKHYIAAYWNISTALMYPYVKAAHKCNMFPNIVQSHAASTDVENKVKNAIQKFTHYCLRFLLNRLNIERCAVSTLAAKWMFGNKKFKYIAEPVDAEKFQYNEKKRQSYRKALEINNEFVVGCVTSFLPVKNPLFIADVMHEFQEKNSNSKLIVCGDGPLKNEFEKLCEAILKPNTYKILGYVKDIPDILQAFDAFILPSKYEGLGMALVEAQSSGLPCVYSKNLPKEAAPNMLLSYPVKGFDAKQWSDTLIKISKKEKKRTNVDWEIVEKSGFNKNSLKPIIDMINS